VIGKVILAGIAVALARWLDMAEDEALAEWNSGPR
jgi:hypothetical protein